MNEGTIWAVLIVGAFASGFWVSVDTANLNLDGSKRTGWVLLCFVMWYIGLPIYLLKRREYKRLNFGKTLRQVDSNDKAGL